MALRNRFDNYRNHENLITTNISDKFDFTLIYSQLLNSNKIFHMPFINYYKEILKYNNTSALIP